MADKRKLQCEIDKTLKRVQEGRTSFQEILDKFESSASQTQKEKFETDLKKEIKRLQRFRDQIKTWVACNEIKDKRPLFDSRKLIEQDMERFKVIEKETKTKAYSKEGLLSADAKKDPLQKEKEELDDWLKQSIQSFQTQAERYEFELENLITTGKKKRHDKDKSVIIEEKNNKLGLCEFHIEKLETVMRHLDNERLECALVRTIKDQVECVIENLEVLGMDDQTLYDELHLEDLGDTPLITTGGQVTAGSVEHDLSTNILSSSLLKNGDDTGSVVLIGSSTSSNASSSRERPNLTDDKPCVITPLSVSSTSTPVKNINEPNVKSKHNKSSANSLANQTAPSSFFAHTIPAPSPNKATSGKSFAGAPIISLNPSNQPSGKAKLNSQSESDTITTPSNAKSETEATDKIPETHRENYAKVAADCKSSGKTESSKPILKQQNPLQESEKQPNESKTTTPTPTITPVKNESKTVEPPSAEIKNPQPKLVTVTTIPTHLAKDPSDSTVVELATLQLPAVIDRDSIEVVSPIGPPQTSTFNITSPPAPIVPTCSCNVSMLMGSPALPSTALSSSQHQQKAAAAAVVAQQQAAVMAAVAQQQHQQRSMNTYVHVHPRDAAAPFRNRQLDKSRQSFPPELRCQMQALDSAYRRLPHPCDTEKSRMIVYKKPVHTPSYYPSEPARGSDSEEYYMKLDAQTLFFLFYYFEGTKAQYLAAKALKRMSWRFHTEYMMWFQRHEEPKQITDEFESGTYIYYDFKTMSQRKKEEFVFHYSFLEDKDF